MVTQPSHLWLRLHGHYRRQHLPFAGGMMQQPNKFIEAMELLLSKIGRNRTNADFLKSIL